MAASIRSVVMGFPKVSMTRVPLAALANTRVCTFTSMPPNNEPNAWVKNAKKVADQLEQSAQKLAGTLDTTTKDYLKEVNRFSSDEDKILKKMGLAMDASKNTANHNDHHHKGAHHNAEDHHNLNEDEKGDPNIVGAPTAFEQTFVDQVQADLIHTRSLLRHDSQHHSEMIPSLVKELKNDKADANLSQHASDAIRMVESHNVVKHDKAPIHEVGTVDPSQKNAQAHEHKSKFPF